MTKIFLYIVIAAGSLSIFTSCASLGINRQDSLHTIESKVVTEAHHEVDNVFPPQ